MMAAAGARASVRIRVLEPSDRASSLPEDTATLPYEVVVRGLLIRPASVGEQATVRTAVGREVTGTLDEIEPADAHGFGRPVPALVAVTASISELAGTVRD